MEIKGDHNERLEINHRRNIRKNPTVSTTPQSENTVFKSSVIFSVFFGVVGPSYLTHDFDRDFFILV
jgi:hypothetical protein